MNHIIRIILALGLSVAAVLLILSSTEHFGPHAQMDVFVAETIRAAVGQDVEIEQYVEASLPRNYQREMSKVPFDGFRSYSTTQWPVQKQYTTAWGEVMIYTASYFAWNARPLPYPPEDVWCVRLKSADPTVPRVLLIAFHKDIYTASWVVHEPNDVAAVLAAVGCRFSRQ
jgi:hypothetical protein